jgi:DNA-binding CsgD family transcriptional regulator
VTSAATDPQVLGDAFYRQGEIHRLRGALAAAETAYRRASDVGSDPQPGLALLRLAQGRGEQASAAIQRALASTSAPLRRARLLPAAVEILLARAQVPAARTAADELARIAARYDLELLGAMAAHATGTVQLAEGNAEGACERLRVAFEVWRDAGMPYVAARIRVAMGRACQVLGDEDGARFEWAAARQVFELLSAHADLETLSGLDHPREPGHQHGLSPREVEVLRLVATGSTNKVIAKTLCLSEKTIDRHLSNIFTKLGVSSRAAATAYAYEHRLV